MDRVALVETIARRWNDAGVTYAVAHGIDGYPTRLGRDIDVVVSAPDVPRAITAARAVLDAAGLAVASPPPLWGERLVAAEPGGSAEVLEVHTVTGVTWRNTALVERLAPSARVGPFAVDPWVSVAKRVVLPLLTGRERILASDPGRLALSGAERGAAAPELVRLAGAHFATQLLAAIDAEDPQAVGALAASLRRGVFRRSAYTRPLSAAALLGRSALRRVRLPLSPCAPVVGVAGASPAETQALLRTIAEGDRLVFTDLCVRRGAPGRLGLARLLRDRTDSGGQRLVLYDAGAGGRAAGWPGLSTPDLLLLVGVDTGAGAPAAGGPARAVLPAGLGADELRRRAVELIIGAFIAKNQRRAPGLGH